MKKILVLIFLVCLFFALPIRTLEPAASNNTQSPQRAAYVPGELLVKYKPSVRAAATTYYKERLGVSTIRTLKKIKAQHVKLPQGMTVEEALEIFKDDPDVEYAEPNYYRYAAVEVIPNDTDFDRLWGLHNTGQSGGTFDADIDAPEAWDITTGSSSVVIAVIDSGVDYNHQDLSGNIWNNPDEIPGNGTDDDGNGKIDDVYGWDFVDNDNNPVDPHGHGTHVAGTIAAVGNNSTGITGVCWNAKIMGIRFLDAIGIGTTADEISAIEYADSKGAHVINCSWGGPDYSQSEKNAIDASSALVVCAAGNDNENNDSTPFYPASYTSLNIIAVAATDQDDERANFSNYGATSVDVAAPGTNIYSCQPGRREVWSDNFEGAFNWSPGGTDDFWGVTGEYSHSEFNSLTDRPDAYYLPNTDSCAQTPIDLSSCIATKLEFWVKGSSQSGDYFYIQCSTNGTDWKDLTLLIDMSTDINWSGSISSFKKATADLGTYDGSGTFYLRFNFHSNSDADVEQGWFFDDVTVSAASSSYDGTEYRYMSGTSMATPHVSGLAALIKAEQPILNNIQIKATIENSVDAKLSLSGKVATAGRVNAYTALILPAAPSGLSAKAVSASKINLTWTDNSSNESGFKIERKTGSGGSYSQIATVSANVASYSNTSLNGSTTYYYRVRSYNASGTSLYSNEATATTPAPSGGGGGGGGGGCFITTTKGGFK